MSSLLWRWAPVVAYMAAIFVMSSIPGTEVPLPHLWRYDKLLHATCFAGLAALLYRARPGVPFAVGVATTYGALDEFHQRYTPNRSSDPMDLLADFVGATLGALLAHVWILRIRRAR